VSIWGETEAVELQKWKDFNKSNSNDSYWHVTASVLIIQFKWQQNNIFCLNYFFNIGNIPSKTSPASIFFLQEGFCNTCEWAEFCLQNQSSLTNLFIMKKMVNALKKSVYKLNSLLQIGILLPTIRICGTRGMGHLSSNTIQYTIFVYTKTNQPTAHKLALN